MTYRPPYVRVDERAPLLTAIGEHPLATLVTTHDGEISLTHLPLFAAIEDDRVLLRGHIARANEHWCRAAESAAATFMIASHYISPAWYPTTQRDPRTVPTYDYVAIEARGAVRFIHDRDWLEAAVRTLTDMEERRIHGTWRVDDAPRAYIESELAAIVGVEMHVTTLHGTYKLNQHHPQENIEGIVCGLQALGTPEARAFADRMKVRAK